MKKFDLIITITNSLVFKDKLRAVSYDPIMEWFCQIIDGFDLKRKEEVIAQMSVDINGKKIEKVFIEERFDFNTLSNQNENKTEVVDRLYKSK